MHMHNSRPNRFKMDKPAIDVVYLKMPGKKHHFKLIFNNRCLSNVGWLFACSASSHYRNQCWLIVNWTSKNQFQWNSDWNSIIFIQENTIWNCHLSKCRPFCPEGCELTLAPVCSWPNFVNIVAADVLAPNTAGPWAWTIQVQYHVLKLLLLQITRLHFLRILTTSECYHTEAQTKWLPFSRRHFQMHFL